MEALPLRTILRKIVWMRLVVCIRRFNLRTQQGRNRVLMTVGITLLILCSVSVLSLPDPDDAAHAHLTARSGHASHSEQLKPTAEMGVEGAPNSMGPSHGVALPDDVGSSHPSPAMTTLLLH